MHGGYSAVLKPGAALPCICLKCGAAAGVTYGPKVVIVDGLGGAEALERRMKRARIVGLIYGVVGILATIGAMAAGFERAPAMFVSTLVLVCIGVAASVSRETRATMHLPLCAFCEGRWRRAEVIRRVVLILLCAGLIAAPIEPWLGVPIMGLSVMLLVITRVTRSFVGGWELDDGAGRLLFGLAPDAATALAEPRKMPEAAP